MSKSSSQSAGRVIPYRPEIDGLRALAVIVVIAFHADIPGFSGGFVGVDVFFVISGYLITSIIARQHAEGRFSLVEFYERRVRRILPALFVYAALASALAIWLYPPHFLKQFGQSLVAMVGFVSNLLFYWKTDYFNDFQATAPLLHTWSLAVEEQYYLIAPLLLMLCLRRSRRLALGVMAMLACVSLIHAQWVLDRDAPFAFYSITSRFWELALGGCLALIGERWRLPKANAVAAIVGLSMIGFAVVSYSATTPFPGLSGLLPVAGTALLIAFAHGQSGVAKTLGHGVLRAIGLISYSWYLSHFVLFAIARSQGFELGLTWVSGGLIVLSLGLAVMTYVFVEQPARRTEIRRGRVFAFAIAAGALLAALGLVIHATNGLRDMKLSALTAEERASVQDYDAAMKRRQAILADLSPGFGRPFHEGAGRKVLVLGDSLSRDFLAATHYADFAATRFRANRMDDECMAGSAAQAPASRRCQRMWQLLLEGSNLTEADEVTLVASWKATTIPRVVQFVQMLRAQGKPVTILSSADFTHAASLSYNAARAGLSGDDAEPFYYANIRKDARKAYDQLKTAIETEVQGVRFLEKLDAFCDLESQRCTLRHNGEWLIVDANHLSEPGFRYFADQIRALEWYR